MASIDEERVERLRHRYGQGGRRRTTSVRKAAAAFATRARGLTVSRSRDVAADADGAAFREAFAGAIHRKH
jgi:hypothetical protein